MVNWQSILWELRRNYKPLAAIAVEVGHHPKSLQSLASGRRNHDLPYSVGVKVINLHKKYCENNFD